MNITTSSFCDLNLRNTYENSTVVIGTDGTTGTISNIGNGIIEISCSGIQVPAFGVTGGVLNTDHLGNITSIPLGSLDIPIPYTQVAVGNASNYLSSTTSLEVIGTTTKAIDLTGSTSFFQTITGVSIYGNANFNAITGTSSYFNSITGGTISSSNITGTSAYFSNITGISTYMNTITGSSAYFNQIVSSITGDSATFNSITGTTVSYFILMLEQEFSQIFKQGI